MRNPLIATLAMLLTLPWAATASAATPAVAVHMNVWSTKVLVFELRTGEAVGEADLPRFASAFWIDNAQKP